MVLKMLLEDRSVAPCSVKPERTFEMKIDRFVKVMLVLIAVLLALNCAKDLESKMLSSDAAPPPSFLQVGKSYKGVWPGGSTPFTVLEVQNTGWIKVQDEGGGFAWLNTSLLLYITPQK